MHHDGLDTVLFGVSTTRSPVSEGGQNISDYLHDIAWKLELIIPHAQ